MDHNLLEKIYLALDELTWDDVAKRVSCVMDTSDDRELAHDMLRRQFFIPNTPTLTSFGRAHRSLAACYVLHVPNSIEGIFDTLKTVAIILKSSAGVGLNFSALSPRGTQLKYLTQGFASGPLAFMRCFNACAEALVEGGVRTAAMMGILSVLHPDIEEFIQAKQDSGLQALRRFNLSVTIPRGGPDAVPDATWQKLVDGAWRSGEPGVVFLDNLNQDNAAQCLYGQIETVNACAENGMYDGESCVLASINLPKVITSLGDYTLLREVAGVATEYLDNIIDLNPYPSPFMETMTKRTRRIGVGVMGFATLLEQEGIPYDSPDIFTLIDDIGHAIKHETYRTSRARARHLGGYYPGRMRNVATMTIAPTGHIHRLAGVSPSIYLPYDVSLDMSPQQHIEYVAAWQRWVDNGISYTVNLSEESTHRTADTTLRLAYEHKLKAIAIYRDGSRPDQPLTRCKSCSGGACQLK